jgi:hypothetical protein
MTQIEDSGSRAAVVAAMRVAKGFLRAAREEMTGIRDGRDNKG